MTDAILTTGLRKAFGRTQALAGVDLRVGPGEVHGFLGPNGAGKSTGAALAYVPALWVVTGFAVAVVGLVPRWSWLAWVGVAYPFAIYYGRTYLSAPAWSDALSPYSHVALVPAEHVSWWSLLALVGVAAALIAVGIGAFRRRDVMPG